MRSLASPRSSSRTSRLDSRSVSRFGEFVSGIFLFVHEERNKVKSKIVREKESVSDSLERQRNCFTVLVSSVRFLFHASIVMGKTCF